jgi:hypothetical protein
VGLRPEPPPRRSGLRLQVSQALIRGVSPKPPCPPGPDDLLVQGPAVRKDDVRDQTSVAIPPVVVHRDELAEGQPGRELLGPMLNACPFSGASIPFRRTGTARPSRSTLIVSPSATPTTLPVNAAAPVGRREEARMASRPSQGPRRHRVAPSRSLRSWRPATRSRSEVRRQEFPQAVEGIDQAIKGQDDGGPVEGRRRALDDAPPVSGRWTTR